MHRLSLDPEIALVMRQAADIPPAARVIMRQAAEAIAADARRPVFEPFPMRAVDPVAFDAAEIVD